MPNKLSHKRENQKSTAEKSMTFRSTVIALLVITFFVLVVCIYYRMLYNEKRNNIIAMGRLTAGNSADQLDIYLSTNIDSISLAAYSLDGMMSEKSSDAEIQEYLVSLSTAIKSAVNENSTGLYGYINGRFFSGTNWVPPEGYDATARPWYTKPLENPGEITILDPYLDVQSGNIMLALGKTLSDGVSVISVDVSLEQVQNIMEDAVTAGDTDIEMILNDKGVVVAHSDSNEVGDNYSEEDGTLGAAIFDALEGSESGVYEIHFEDSHYIAYVAPIRENWCCISVMNATETFDSLNSILLFTFLIVIIIVLILSIIMTKSNKRNILAQKAIAASEAKSAFLSRMSHEIRTPINAVLGMNEMVLRESGDENVIEYSHNIRTAGHHLLAIVNDILDFSKIESGKMKIVPVVYDLPKLLNDLVTMIQSRAQEKGLELTLDFDKELPRELLGDEVHIKQVITNILTNAVKYTEKGSVVFSMGFEKTEDYPDSLILKVTVKDTGIGIRAEDMNRLFSEFERIDEDKNRNIEGTGLGMSITHSLLEMMGTTLEVESEYGAGSVFSFKLKQTVVNPEPIGDFEECCRKKQAEFARYRERFTAQNACVLVVDDNPMNLVVFKSLLKKTRIIIDTAGGGNEAVEKTLEKQYDIIFMDHMMPEKDGIEAFHDIRNNEFNPNRVTPVVVLTANAISGAKEEYLEQGFDDYLTKPIDSMMLEDTILTFLPHDKISVVEEPEEPESFDVENMDVEGLRDVLPEFLFSLKELDLRTGLKQNGSPEAYLETLKLYGQTAEEYAEDIDNFLNAGNMKNVIIKVHALKSTLRIIGATELGTLAEKLELAGKAGAQEALKKEMEVLLCRTRALGKEMSELLPPDENANEKDGGALQPVSREQLDEAYVRILEYAKDCDNAGIEDVLGELKEFVIPDTDTEKIKAIAQAVADFDFDSVTALLTR